MKKNTYSKGITLVALVVTIVVLLILAGITIVYVFGDNGVFGKAEQAKIQAELGKIEERAQVIYSDKLLENASSTLNTKVETSQIIEKLKAEGYTIEKRPVKEGDITGISLDKESMTIGKNKTVELKVTYEGVDDPFVYYVEIQGKYYQMHSNKGFITIDREASTLTKADFETEDGEGSTTTTLTVTSSDETVVMATLKEGSNKTIEITSKEIEGEKTVTITVSYGSLEPKTCIVKVVEPVIAKGISLNAKFAVVTGGQSWTNDFKLVANLEPSNVTEKEVTWESSDESVATVDANGNVKAVANGKGGDIKIKATTKDGSNLTAESNIRVEMFGTINSDNTDYIDNSSQETYKTIVIPKDYAVGTSDNINKIDGGLVIQDIDGNQFVWVPVNDTAFTKMIDETNHRGNLYEFSTTGTKRIAYSETGKHEPDILKGYDGSDASINASYFKETISSTMTGAQFKTQLQNEFNNMGASVKKYHGFFIGRYETGNLEANSTNVPVVQRGNTKIDNVNWYYTYAQGKRIAKNSNVTSSMIWGCQWDRTLDWIVARNGGDYSLVTNSVSWGNYYTETFEYLNADGTTKEKSSSVVIPTGSTERNKKNNIYDLAGNCSEWTLEYYVNNQQRTLRRRTGYPVRVH